MSDPAPQHRSRFAAVAPWAIVAVSGLVIAAVLWAAAGQSSTGGAASAGDSPSTAAFASGVSPASASLLELQRTTTKAPDFHLTDQSGKPMDLSTFAGRSVVLTFNDDQCEDLCTLLAQDVVAADKDLGAAADKVAFVSINANPFSPSVRDVAAWSDQHGLRSTSNWYYGTADPSALTKLWNSYQCEVDLDRSARTVEHCATMYFIDPKGVERAVAQFGTASADTAPFSHAVARMAADLAGSTAAVAGPSLPTPAAKGTALGERAPALTGTDENGAPPRIGVGGKLTVIDFWSSTCTACRDSLPDLAAEQKAVGSSVDFVGVDVDDTATRGHAFTASLDPGLRSVLDADGSTAGAWRITGLPYTVIVGTDGRVAVRHAGTMTTEQLDYLLQSLGT